MAKKCPVCNKLIKDESIAIPYKNRLAHPDCFNNMMKALRTGKNDELKEKAATKKKRTPKPKAELKDPVSEEDYQKKKSYYEYIHSYYEAEDGKLPAKIYVLTEKYIEQYGVGYEELHQVLIYMREIINKELQGDGVGLIPYYIDEARDYYKSLKQIEEINKDKDITNMYHSKTIVIHPHKRMIKQLDISGIG